MIVCAHAGAIPLADETVQCVVTSPPYWGLRRYAGSQELIWGRGSRERTWLWRKTLLSHDEFRATGARRRR